MGARRLQRVEHVLHAELQVLGKLVHAWRTPCLRGQLLLRFFHLERLLLCTTWDVHRPTEIAEVALQLSQDRRNCERRERGPAFGVEPIYCLDEAEARDLHQIFERLAWAGVAARKLAGQWQEPFDQFLPGSRVMLLLPPYEQVRGVGSGNRESLHVRRVTP